MHFAKDNFENMASNLPYDYRKIASQYPVVYQSVLKREDNTKIQCIDGVPFTGIAVIDTADYNVFGSFYLYENGLVHSIDRLPAFVCVYHESKSIFYHWYSMGVNLNTFGPCYVVTIWNKIHVVHFKFNSGESTSSAVTWCEENGIDPLNMSEEDSYFMHMRFGNAK